MKDYIGNSIVPAGRGIRESSFVLPKSYDVLGKGAGLFSQPFTTEWTVAGDAAARTVTLPLVPNRAEGALSYDAVVDWGDGTTPSLVTSYNDVNRIHTYTLDGTYQIKIYGTLEGWSFNGGGDYLKITKVIHWGAAPSFSGFKYLANGFYDCTNLTSIGNSPVSASGDGIESDGFSRTFRYSGITSVPASLFSLHPLAETFYNCFDSCTGLLAVPAALFAANIQATNFNGVLRNTGITSVPAGLFSANTLATDFAHAFRDLAIETVPATLFSTNTLVTDFSHLFEDSGLTALPDNFFANNTAVLDFSSVCRDCHDLITVGSGVFDNTTLVTSFNRAFLNCPSLETTPSGLFRYNTAAVDFTRAFYICVKHQQNIDLFYAAGEEATRFLNQDVDFTECFIRSSFTGTQGTAPDLWNCDFGTGTPTTTGCWSGAGNSTSSLTNYTSIPGVWI